MLSKNALNHVKYEASQELGYVPDKKEGNSKNGKVGGLMMKKLFELGIEEFQKQNTSQI